MYHGSYHLLLGTLVKRVTARRCLVLVRATPQVGSRGGEEAVAGSCSHLVLHDRGCERGGRLVTGWGDAVLAGDRREVEQEAALKEGKSGGNTGRSESTERHGKVDI